MNEIEKIAYAKSFIDKLANGVNPIDDTPIKADDVVNNVRISRCLFYVSNLLRDMIENQPKAKTRKLDFSLSAEQLAAFEYSEKPIPISEIAKRINALRREENMKKLANRNITDWLLKLEILCERENLFNGKISKFPTPQGEELGISVEERVSSNGKAYTVTVYSKAAQEFILDNMDAIVAMKYKK